MNTLFVSHQAPDYMQQLLHNRIASLHHYYQAAQLLSNYSALCTYPSLIRQSLFNTAAAAAAADLPNIISVGSITSTGAISSFSNFGATTVDLFAPGSSILSTWPSYTYNSICGTSMVRGFGVWTVSTG
jgi:subtilisin family serine protease